MDTAVPLTKKPTFDQVMREIHATKPERAVIDGVEYQFTWTKSLAKVTRSDCPWYSGFTENLPQLFNQREGDFAWKTFMSRTEQIEAAQCLLFNEHKFNELKASRTPPSPLVKAERPADQDVPEQEKN
jgi:hypothetical protein